jgi:hypothetical protein
MVSNEVVEYFLFPFDKSWGMAAITVFKSNFNYSFKKKSNFNIKWE